MAAIGKGRNRLHGYPRGWFMVAFSDELEIGDVISLPYFGSKLIAYRGEDGEVRIMDAFCPHLGADLAAGGKVIGTSIRCPFHHWRFAEDGKCVEIPYCSRIPKKAELKTWDVVERNGMIFVWYHPRGEAADFDVPTLPNHESDNWTKWAHSKIQIKTHSREIVENVVDIAHFSPVHGTEIDEFENRFDGHIAAQIAKGVAYPRGGGIDRFRNEATYYGPGFQISHMDGYMQSMLVNAHTMIDENTLDLRFGVTVAPRDGFEVTQEILDQYVDNLTVGFLEDVQIWENKVWRDTPMLCADDGPIGKVRRWYAQFYEAPSADKDSLAAE